MIWVPLDWRKRGFEGAIEGLVAVTPKAGGLHSAAKQVKPKVKIARMIGVIGEKSHRRRLEARHRASVGITVGNGRRTKPCQRGHKHLGVKCFSTS